MSSLFVWEGATDIYGKAVVVMVTGKENSRVAKLSVLKLCPFLWF